MVLSPYVIAGVSAAVGTALGVIVAYPIGHAMGERKAQWDAIARRTEVERLRARERAAMRGRNPQTGA